MKIPHEIKISVTELKEFQVLIDTLSDNFDGLPDDVKSAVTALASGSWVVIDCDYIERVGLNPSDVECLVDGVVTPHVVWANPFTKTVFITGVGPKKCESFLIKHRNEITQIGWGNIGG